MSEWENEKLRRKQHHELVQRARDQQQHSAQVLQTKVHEVLWRPFFERIESGIHELNELPSARMFKVIDESTSELPALRIVPDKYPSIDLLIEFNLAEFCIDATYTDKQSLTDLGESERFSGLKLGVDERDVPYIWGLDGKTKREQRYEPRQLAEAYLTDFSKRNSWRGATG